MRNPWFIGPSFGPINTEIAGIISSLGLLSLAFPNDEKLKTSFMSHWNTTDFPRKTRNFN